MPRITMLASAQRVMTRVEAMYNVNQGFLTTYTSAVNLCQVPVELFQPEFSSTLRLFIPTRLCMSIDERRNVLASMLRRAEKVSGDRCV